jgi:hypothetical protein
LKNHAGLNPDLLVINAVILGVVVAWVGFLFFEFCSLAFSYIIIVKKGE